MVQMLHHHIMQGDKHLTAAHSLVDWGIWMVQTHQSAWSLISFFILLLELLVVQTDRNPPAVPRARPSVVMFHIPAATHPHTQVPQTTCLPRIGGIQITEMGLGWWLGGCCTCITIFSYIRLLLHHITEWNIILQAPAKGGDILSKNTNSKKWFLYLVISHFCWIWL